MWKNCQIKRPNITPVRAVTPIIHALFSSTLSKIKNMFSRVTSTLCHVAFEERARPYDCKISGSIFEELSFLAFSGFRTSLFSPVSPFVAGSKSSAMKKMLDQRQLWREKVSIWKNYTQWIFTNHTFCEPCFGGLVSGMTFHNIPSLHLPMILCYFVSICLWFQSNCRKFALVGLICLSAGECIIFEFKAIASWSGWKHFFRWMYLYWYCTTFVF